ncbi:MAG: polysaccharide deacetylase family protein, partial [Crocinitomicaceae bacterium]|nr:polysaccharide deacetylase family protein [Crocinitomicaceae bacterium]
RPAYGRLKRSQFRLLKKEGYQIILWSVLSYDFDKTITPEKIIQVLEKNVKPGSIIVFHDSEKAWPNLKVVLPTIMESWKQKGFKFESIST